MTVYQSHLFPGEGRFVTWQMSKASAYKAGISKGLLAQVVINSVNLLYYVCLNGFTFFLVTYIHTLRIYIDLNLKFYILKISKLFSH